MMKISIITVCFNSADTIRDTIESVLAQSYKNIEFIIVDGASTDNTLSIINEYRSGIDVVISECDEGLYDAMNKGIRAASGEVVGIINSDDFYADSFVVSLVAEHFSLNPESDLIIGNMVYVDPNNLDKTTRYYNTMRFQTWKLRFGWMPAHLSTFVRRSSYDKVGLYSLEYKISADYEMFVRLLMVARLKFTHLNRVLVKMRTGGVSSSGISSSILLNKEIVKACRNNGVYTNILWVLLKTPFKLLELVRRP